MFTKKRIYQYLLLISCAGLVAITFGLVNIQGLFFDSISETLGIGKGITAFYVTIIHISGALFAPIGVSLRKKYSIRKIILVDGLLVLSGLMLIPRAKAIWQIYICAFVIGTGQGVYGHAMVVELINRWFAKASTAIGISMCASGLFGSIFSPIIVNGILKYGWQKAYYIFAICVFVVLLYSFIVIKDKPVNDLEEEKDENDTTTIINKDIIFVACFYLFTSSMASMSNYILGYSVDIGLSMSQGASLSSILNLGNLFLKLILGVLCDVLGGLKAATIAYSLITIGSLSLLFIPASNYFILFVGTFLLGATFAGSNVLTSSICRDLFGKDKVGKVYATITSLSVISAFSSTIIGFVYDLTSSYKYSIAGMEILITVALILVYNSFKKKRTQ